MSTAVDVVVLTRDNAPINSEVENSINEQDGVDVRLHRVVGTVRPSDRNRWDTIARARNIGRTLGATPWVMFVDDDVVLDRNCISQLLSELEAKPNLASVAADYRGERSTAAVSPHVAMGATLFRRSAFTNVGFRAATDTCECQCMADDLRSLALEIDYSPTAGATHLSTDAEGAANASSVANAKPNADYRPEPAVMVAFDRSHMGLFLGRFIKYFRESGNRGTKVHAVTYGLRPKDLRRISQLANVQIHPQPFTTDLIYHARMRGFQTVLQSICPRTPIAYWDAGDVVFQRSLDPLWDAVREAPDQLLVTEEPSPWSKNPGQHRWINQIHDRRNRAAAFEVLRGKPIVNGGFIAGTAGLMKSYFERAFQLANGRLFGAGGGDQVILNVCRYESPDSFNVVDETWNYCLLGRSGRECKIRNGQYVDVVNGRLVAVVHGNGASLKG